MNEEQDKSEPVKSWPTGAQEVERKKPIKTVLILVYLIGGLLAIVLISNISNFGSIKAKVPKSTLAQKPTAVNPESVGGYKTDLVASTEKLQKENEAAQETLAKAMAGLPNADGSPQPCTPKIAGAIGTSSAGAPILCGADGKWHEANEAPGIPAASKAQRRGMYPEDQAANPNNAAADARAAAKKRRDDALNSSSVAIDFNGKHDTEHVARTDDREAAEQHNEREPVTSAENAPHPIDITDHSPKGPKYPWDAYSGKTYKVFDGTVLETVLTNRINGAFAGPINTMVTTDIWSHNHQKMLIPQGTRCLGEVRAVNSAQQQRLFVSFHRCIMPDGYSLDLDKFIGLNQIGETGLRDKVNNHYLQIFGVSLAVGAVGGLAQVGNTGGIGYSPESSIRSGISQQTSQEAIHILDRFLNQLPTFTLRERSRVPIYISADLDVPAYDAHQVDPTL